MGEIMIPVQIEDILEELDDEDLLAELRSRGVTALKASEKMDGLLIDMERTYRARDDMHFGILIERLRGMCG